MNTIHSKLREAFDSWTRINGAFPEMLKSIKWDAVYKADGEVYYIKDDFTLITSGAPCFTMARPEYLAGDGSMGSL